MIRLKNISLEQQSIPSIDGAWEIDPGAITPDLIGDSFGQPRNLKVNLDSSFDLDDALRSGNWAAVDDDDNEVGTQGTRDLFVPCSRLEAETMDGRISAPWTTLDPNPGSGDWFDIPGLSWTLLPFKGLAVNAALSCRVGLGGTSGAPLEFTAVMNGITASISKPWTSFYSRGVSRWRVEIYQPGLTLDVRVRARRNGSDPVQYQYTGKANVET